ncbi:MAG: transglycosylase SLT domain-containing protein [Nanoarchaeota archaeon]|nr:transglycosylase SLT domain-containing protein [Nanoarchaeota archaeon]
MKNKMMLRIEILLVVAAALSLILFANPVLAFSDSTFQTSAFNNLISPTASSGFDNSMCQQGQDFILQISPTGCMPAVVRSDLLEQQDVPVMCPIVATQINPLISVNSIQGMTISVSGNASRYVNTAGFYPAQAALNLQGQQNTYPLLSNVGYAVIDLKQMPNESSMPDFVSGNLTATINYNAQNIFGGNSNFYIPVMSDSDWQNNYPDYNFWNSKGYLRVTSIQNDNANINVYGTNLNQLSSLNLKTGQTSGNIAIPGFDFCSATMQIKLNSLQNANTMANLEVNGNPVTVEKGGQFIDNNCQVSNIYQQGLSQDVQIGCNTDSGNKNFDLRVAPKLVMNINGQTRTVGLGDYLYTIPGDPNAITDAGKSVFLAYIGSNNTKGDLNGLYVYLVALPKNALQSESSLTNDELSSIASWVQHENLDFKVGMSGILSGLLDVGKVFAGTTESILRYIISGQDLALLPYNPSMIASNQNIPPFQQGAEQSVSIVSFAAGSDMLLQSPVNQYYQNATKDYQAIQNNYKTETYSSAGTATLGEQALYQQMSLAYNLGEKYTLNTLCNQFEQQYPKSTYDTSFCSGLQISSQTSASQLISINGQSYQINLKSVYTPTYNDYGAQILVKYKDGSSKQFDLGQNEMQTINDTSGEFMQLVSLTPTTATVSGNIKAFSSNTVTLTENVPAVFGNYVLTLQNVNLKQFADISVISNLNTAGARANVSFNISIEKRLIQLNPDKVKQQISDLNSTISTWESIANTTGTVVQALGTVCQDVGIGLTVKNLLTNLFTMTGTARQIVMTGAGGWNSKCQTLINNGKYSTLDQCFNDNSKQIDSDVSQMSQFMQSQNAGIQNLQKDYTQPASNIVGQVFQGSTVNTDKFMSSYLPQIQSCLANMGTVASSSDSSKTITSSQAQNLLIYQYYTNNFFSLSDARNVELYCNILNSNDASTSLKAIAQQGMYSTLSGIQQNSNTFQQQQTIAAKLNVPSSVVFTGSLQQNSRPISITAPQSFGTSPFTNTNLNGLPAGSHCDSNPQCQSGDCDPTLKVCIGNPSIDPSSYYFIYNDQSSSNSYLVDYNADGIVQGTYLINTASNTLSQITDAKGNIQKNYFNFAIKIYSAGSYQNEYKNPTVQYFETSPYQGMPAIVPFDLKNGWYAAVRQVLPTGGNSATQSYTAAGQVQSFYLCNVGPNGLEDGINNGDDICEGINLGTNQPYNQFPGITDPNQASQLVNSAESAIKQAAQARANNPSGLTYVTINNQRIKVGAPATSTPQIQCTDFMSPTDCNILFNACDPVVCPASRCDFGGAYHVQDVVQSGIIGSIALCLPNYKEGIAVPVCLTGIQAGVENIISYQKAYRDCLQNNLNTGQTTGICNEILSIYLCQDLWQQAQPLANLAVSKVTQTVLGQNNAGGGEYMSVQNAYNTAQQSFNYITNYYASSSSKSFSSLSTQNLGATVCQNFPSIVFPNSANMLTQLSAIDSPPQFSGNFQEIPFSSATVPPTSQYQVYYHIYAGQNSGAYYSVYLQRSSGSGSSYYQDTSAIRQTDSGYIDTGSYQDQTKDFTAPSGYDQLCINVNGQVDCGFKQVSTSLVPNYIQAQYLADQANNTQITTESQCVSGTIDTSSLLQALNPNVQNAVQNAASPQLYNQGITRICATGNPGQGSDPYAGTQNSRWIKVGSCGSQNLSCWLDTQSVKNAINAPDLASYLANGTTQNLGNATLQSLQSSYLSVLLSQSGYLSNDQFTSSIQDIQSQTDLTQKINTINNVINKVFYNNQKAYLLFLRGLAYGQLALKSYSASIPASGAGQFTSYQDCMSKIASNSVCSAMFPVSSGQGNSQGAPTGTLLPVGSACTKDSDCQSGSCVDTGDATLGKRCAASTNIPNGVTLSSLSNAMSSPELNCQCGNNCEQYAQSLINAANTYHVNLVLLLSIMVQESHCNVNAQTSPDSSGYSSIGLMQIYNSPSNLQQYCVGKISGISSASDITGAVNYDKNIQCGASVLKSKYAERPAPQTYTCDGVTKTYSTPSDAAVRGYIGYGCTNNPSIDVPSYVDDVNQRYNLIMSIINPQQSTATALYQTAAYSPDFVSPVFNYNSLYYEFSGGTWQWSNDGKKWNNLVNSGSLSGSNSVIVQNLNGRSYEQGLKILIDSELSSTGVKVPLINLALPIGYPMLSTQYVSMDHNGQFNFLYSKDRSFPFYFKFLNGKWMWETSSNLNGWMDTSISSTTVESAGAPPMLTSFLSNLDLYQGAEALFNSGGDDTIPVSVPTSAFDYTPSLPSTPITPSSQTQTSSTAQTPSTSSISQSQISSDDIGSYNNFASLFSQYSQSNLPNVVIAPAPGKSFSSESVTGPSTNDIYWTQNDFEALLISIAQQNEWGQFDTSGSWLMGYRAGNPHYQTADIQIRATSLILESAIQGEGNSLADQAGKIVSYDSCKQYYRVDTTKQISCILSIYHTGSYYTGFWFTGIGANKDGNNYASNVLGNWTLWKNYLSLQQGSSSQTPSSSSSSANLNPTSALPVSQYSPFSGVFANYAQVNLPNSVLVPGSIIGPSSNDVYWSQNDFKALLVAIAQMNNFGINSNGDGMMGYSLSSSSSLDKYNQINIVSSALKSAIEGTGSSQPDQAGNLVSYNTCNQYYRINMNNQLTCILNIYKTGMSSDSSGVAYANNVLSLAKIWDDYFSSSGSSNLDQLAL